MISQWIAAGAEPPHAQDPRLQRLEIVPPAARLKALASLQMERHTGCYYVRLMVVDRPGVIADVAAALRDEEISMEAMIQRGRAPGEAVPVVLTTHETEEARMARALARIVKLEAVLEPPRRIRIEAL